MNAALASILEIDLEDIPHFENMEENKWYLALIDWLKSVGFSLITWDQEVSLPGYYIANGLSPRGFEHSVIYRHDKMVHDPHPSKAGLNKITSVWALLPFDPARYNKSLEPDA